MLKYASILKPMFRARGERDFTGQQNRKTKKRQWLVLSKCLTEAPFWNFLAELFFSERAHFSPSTLTPRAFLSTSLPPCFLDTDSVTDEFQLYFITQILLLPGKKLKVEHDLRLLVILAQVPQSTSSGNLTIQQHEHSNMKICLEENI